VVGGGRVDVEAALAYPASGVMDETAGFSEIS